jgi:hypothetical protein
LAHTADPWYVPAGKCSALIKVTADLSDLLFGHSTFDSFTAMTRIFKHYEFSLKHPGVKAQALSFSSYPGELFSDDDLYMTSAKLVVLETTNHIWNPKLFRVGDRVFCCMVCAPDYHAGSAGSLVPSLVSACSVYHAW